MGGQLHSRMGLSCLGASGQGQEAGLSSLLLSWFFLAFVSAGDSDKALGWAMALLFLLLCSSGFRQPFLSLSAKDTAGPPAPSAMEQCDLSTQGFFQLTPKLRTHAPCLYLLLMVLGSLPPWPFLCPLSSHFMPPDLGTPPPGSLP